MKLDCYSGSSSAHLSLSLSTIVVGENVRVVHWKEFHFISFHSGATVVVHVVM